MYKEIIIHGKVHGVFFRSTAAKKAVELGIAGTVQNISDGTLYIEAEGPPEQMQQFIDWCRRGPPLAQVTQVDVKDAGPKGFIDFQIL